MKKTFTFIAAFMLLNIHLFAQEAILSESFDTFPVEGWTIVSTADETENWKLSTDAHLGDGSIKHSDESKDCKDYLISPQIHLPENAVLEFHETNTEMSYYEAHTLYISTGSADPADGDFVKLKDFDETYFSSWGKQEVGLSDYANQDVYLAFYYEGNYASTWSIDELIVYQSNSVDMAAYELTYTGACVPQGTIKMDCKIENKSSIPVENVLIELFRGEEVLGSTSISMDPEKTVTMTFADVNVGNEDATFKVKVSHADDGVALNNEAPLEIKVIQKPVFGMINYSDGDVLPYGPVVVDIEDPSRFAIMSSMDKNTPAMSGAFAGEDYYVSRVNTSDLMGDEPDQFAKINTTTGEITNLGLMTKIVAEMTYDHVTETMYGIHHNDAGESCLVEINLENGQTTIVATQEDGIEVMGLAVHPNGRMYCVDKDGKFYYIIDRSLFNLKELASLSIPGSTYAQSLTYCKEKGVFYYNVVTINDSFLYTIDPLELEANQVGGNLHYNATVSGLGFPDVYEGHDLILIGYLAVKDLSPMKVIVNGQPFYAQYNDDNYNWETTLHNLPEGEYYLEFSVDDVAPYYFCDYTINLTEDKYVSCGFGSSVEEQETIKMAVMPNPAKHQIQLKGIERADVKIYDQLGQCVKQVNYNGQEINVADLSRGIYFIKANMDQGSFNTKVILE